MEEAIETPISTEKPEQDKENEENQEDLAGDKITSDIEEDPTDEELDSDATDSTSEDENTTTDETADEVSSILSVGDSSTFALEVAGVTFTANDNVTVNEASKKLSDETSGSETYSFDAKANDGYQITKVEVEAKNSDSSKTAALATDASESAQKITSAESSANEGYTTYTIPLSDTALGDGFAYADLTALTVTLTVEAVPETYTVTLPVKDEAHATVTISSGATNTGGTYTTDASADIVFTAVADSNYKLEEVTYAVGDSVPVTLTAEGNSYTIPKDDITGDITISVVAKKQLTISFAGYTDKATNHYAVYEVTRKDDGTYEIAQAAMNGTSLSAVEGESVYFFVEAAEMYTLREATASAGRLSRVKNEENGIIYRLLASDDATVTVTVQLDTVTAYRARFRTAADNNYTISTDGTETDTSVDKRIVCTAKEKINFTVTPWEGYEITKIEKLKTPAEGDTEAVYEEVTLTDVADGAKQFLETFTADAKSAEYRVTAVATALKEDGGTVTFAMDTEATDFELAVTEVKNKVVKVENSENTYQLKNGAQYLEFTLSTDNAKIVPVVKVGEKLWSSKTEESPYSYKISASIFQVSTETTIAISQEKATGKLRISANGDWIDLDNILVQSQEDYDSGSEGPTYWYSEGATGEDGYSEYDIPFDEKLMITVRAKNGCAIKSYQIGSAAAKTVNNTKVSIPLTFAANTTIAITSETTRTPVLYEGSSAAGGSVVEKVGNGYPVNYKTTYTAAVQDGPDEMLMLAKATLTGSSLVTEQPRVDSSEAVFTIDAADAGKTLTLKLFDSEEKNAQPVATYTLNVAQAVTGVTVTGVKSGKLTQPVDTNQDYALTVKPTGTDANNLDVDILWADGAMDTDKEAFTAGLNDGKLVITTKTAKDADAAAALKEAAAKATIRFADTTKGTKGQNGNYPEEAIVAGSDFVLEITEPTSLKNATPTVTQKASSDIEITLTLGVPASAKITEPQTGKLWYEVHVKPQTDPTTENGIKAEATYYFEKEDSATQDETIQVIDKTFGEGAAYKFDVTAKLVQTLNTFDLADSTAQDYETNKDAALTEFASKVSKTLPAATKDPYYETKLSLKNGTTTVYTGQENVKIATLNFGKNTTHTDDSKVTAEDITPNLQAGQKLTELVIEDGAVWLSISKAQQGYSSVALGKHTIRVTAQAPEDTYKTYKDMVVTVNRGIEKLELTAPSDTIYKADNQKASLKVTPIYNENHKKDIYEAKSKKVKDYVLVAVDGENPKQDNNGQDVLLNVAGLTVKNGTVDVDKTKFDLTAATEAGNNRFFVRATANDWNGNTTYGYSEIITITSQKVELGSVVIVKETENQNEFEPIISAGKKNATSAQFGELEKETTGVVVLKPGTEAKATYTSDDFVDPTYLTFKSSSAKSLGVGTDGVITAVKPGKNIKLTVTTNDGGKQTALLDKIEIVNAKPAVLGLRVEDVNNYIGGGTVKTDYEELNKDGDYTDTDVSFTGTANSVLRLTVMRNEGEGWFPMDEFSDLKVTISKAKTLNKVSAYNHEYTILANTAQATVKLEYTNDKGTKTKAEYTINNNGVVTGKAPGVKTSDKLVAGPYKGAQHIEFTLNTQGNNYDYVGKVVMVKADASDRNNVKNTERYQSLEKQGNVCRWVSISEDGKFSLDFNDVSWLSDEDCWETNIPAGSYKLNMTFGTLDVNGNVIPDTKAVSVTLKAAAPKAVKSSYKPASKVKMSVYDTAAGTKLTGTGKNIDTDTERYKDLLNANITGQANHFRDLFELEADNVLKLKSDFSVKLKTALKNAGEIETDSDEAVLEYITASTSKAAKNDRIGYVAYSVTGLDEKEYEGTTQLTVTFDNKKATDTYTLTNTTILQGTETAEVQVLKNRKTGAEIADAYVVSSDKDGVFTVKAAGNDKITLTLNETTKETANKYKVTIAVVPQNNYYAASIESLKQAWSSDSTNEAKKQAYVDAITNHGVTLTTNVTVGEKGKTGNKISVAKNLLKPSFTGSYYYKDGVEAGYDGKHQNYWIHVPYTKNMECNIASIDSNDTKYVKPENDDTDRKNLINFGTGSNNGSDFIDINLNKQELLAAIAAGNVRYSPKGVATLSVKATVHFTTKKNDQTQEWIPETDSEGKDVIKAETITFNLTFPAQPTENSIYSKAVEAVRDDRTGIAERAVPADWMWNGEGLLLPTADSEGNITLTDNDNSEAFHRLNGLVCRVRDEISLLAPEDCDVKIVMPQEAVEAGDHEEMKFAGADFTAPTREKAGSFKVKAYLYDASTLDEDNNIVTGNDNPSEKEDIVITLTIPVLKEKAADVEKLINSFVTQKSSDTTYIDSLKNDGGAQLAADARIAAGIVNDEGVPTSTLRLNIEKWEYEDATTERGGTIKGEIHVYGYRYGGEEVRVSFTFTGTALENLADTVKLVDNAVKKITASNSTTKAEILKAANDAIRNPQFNAVWQTATDTTLKDTQDNNSQVKDADDEVYKLVQADRTKAGYVIGTIVVEDSENADATDNTVNVNLNIAQLTTDENAVKLVKAAVAIDADSDTVKAEDMKALILKYGNTEKGVEEGILTEANEAVAKDGYTVAYKVENEKPVFAFTAAKRKATGTEGQDDYDDGKGSISFTLVLTDTLKDTPAALAAEVTIPANQAYKFGPFEELQKLTEAKTDVEAALETCKNSVNNATDQTAVETAVKAVVKGTGLSVKVEDFTKTEATVKEAGRITCTVTITDANAAEGTEPVSIPFNATITKLTQTLAQARTAAENVLNGMTALDNEAIETKENTDTVKQDVLKGIVTAVEAVVDTEAFIVAIDDTTGAVTAQKATTDAQGSIKITVKITEKKETGAQSDTATKTWTIAQLENAGA